MKCFFSILYERFIIYSEKIGNRLKRYNFPRWVVDAIFWPSDKYKILKTFNEAFGWQLDLNRPETFNEWLQYTKLYFRKPHHILIADKIAAREYIQSRIGNSMLTNLYWSGTLIEECDFTKLPARFVIKTNHISGYLIIVRNKMEVSWPSICRDIKEWLKHDLSSRYGEWQYRWIQPKILIEEFLETPNRSGLIEYQFFCIMGQCVFVEVDFDRFANHKRLFFNRDFQQLNMQIRLPEYEGSISKPMFFTEMLEAAEVLANNEMFLRIDFFDAGSPKIGELTLHPGAGMVKFTPPDWDLKWGSLFRN